MKGFLGGVSIGALVAVAGAAMWSLSVPLPTGVQVASTTPDTVSSPSSESNTPPQAEERRDADLVETAPTSPQGSDGADTSPVATLDMSSGERPEVATVESGAKGDTSETATVGALPQTSDAVAVAPTEADAPDAPGEENAVVVSSETTAPPVEPAEEGGATEASTAVETEVTAEARATDVEPTGEGGDADTSVASAAGQAPKTPVTDLSGPQIGTAPEVTARPSVVVGASARSSAAEELETAQQDDIAPQTGDTAEASVAAADTSEAAPEALDEAPQDEIETVALPTTDEGATGPSIGTPVVPLTERGNASRLIGTGAGGDQATVDASRIVPFVANANEYVALDDRPLMSIVLIDDEAAIGAEALEEFPYPLTFAIDPEDPKAIEKMQARRAAGFEVLILADLPREAAPQDAETTMAVWMEQLPQAVGFLEGIETGFQGNRPLADQMVAVMQDAGYGMVTQNSGLNTVQKLALRDGMPSGVVFRDFDGAGQNPRAIRRFLDQAAFRARQEGTVIMLGRLRPDTISALLLWGLQDRASQVGLAPISAGLKANLTPEG